jgi:4-hydroxy-2-oxoheptanedioate aldolase
MMNWIKKRILNGELLSGMFLNLGAGCVAQMAGRAGLDWVLIDMEHGLIDYSSLASYIQAANAGGAAPVVRVMANSAEHFKKALDLGASGIMVPQVNTADEARMAARYLRYPPAGVRGMTRTNWASSFGFDSKEYLREANDNLLLAVQIETAEGVSNAAEIAAVDGVDVLFVGPSDLSCSLGVACDLKNSMLKECIEGILAAARKYGKNAGILIKDPSGLAFAVQNGFMLVAMGTDIGIVKDGITEIAEMFKNCKKGQ